MDYSMPYDLDTIAPEAIAPEAIAPEAIAEETFNDLLMRLADVQNLLSAGALSSDYRAVRLALYDCVGHAEYLGKL